MSDLVFARNYSVARMIPGEAELVSAWRGFQRAQWRFHPWLGGDDKNNNAYVMDRDGWSGSYLKRV